MQKEQLRYFQNEINLLYYLEQISKKILLIQ